MKCFGGRRETRFENMIAFVYAVGAWANDITLTCLSLKGNDYQSWKVFLSIQNYMKASDIDTASEA